jgi:hypothetical protein
LFFALLSDLFVLLFDFGWFWLLGQRFSLHVMAQVAEFDVGDVAEVLTVQV